jgi:MYXO-CTERM domain-containing protein
MAWARLGLVVLAGGAAALAGPGLARACNVSQQPAMIDPTLQKVDHTPPVLPAIPPPTITRGQGPQNEGCGGAATATSCDDLGMLVFTVAGTDDMTPPTQLGYLFTLASGTLPDGFTLPPEPLLPDTATSITLVWVDAAINGQDPLDFTLSVVAVDGAGNQSAPRLVEVKQGSAGGCRVGPRARSWRGVFVVLGAMLLAARRRRRAA